MDLDPLKHTEDQIYDPKQVHNKEYNEHILEHDEQSQLEILREEANDDHMIADELQESRVEPVEETIDDVVAEHIRDMEPYAFLEPFLNETLKDSHVCVDKMFQVFKDLRVDDEWKPLITISDSQHWVELYLDEFVCCICEKSNKESGFSHHKGGSWFLRRQYADDGI